MMGRDGFRFAFCVFLLAIASEVVRAFGLHPLSVNGIVLIAVMFTLLCAIREVRP